MVTFTIEDFVPDGILPNDHWHQITNDHTCSRCRTAIGEEEIPLMIWSGSGVNMLCYCERCTGRVKR